MGSVFDIAISIFTSIIGVICLGSGIIGYLLKETRLYERILLFAAAFLLINPGWTTDLIGFLCVGITVAVQLKKRAHPVTLGA